MATLSADVISRYSAQFLVEITNADSVSATTRDDTRLDLAATDIQNDLETYAGQLYDSTNAQHVSVAVQGVIARLTSWNGESGDLAEKMEDRFVTRARALRKRVRPKTSSTLVPTAENVNNATPKPWTDISHFTGVTPNPPTRGQSLPGD